MSDCMLTYKVTIYIKKYYNIVHARPARAGEKKRRKDTTIDCNETTGDNKSDC